MKKFFSPEVKIALVAVAGIVVLFFGMQFLKGLNLFSSDVRYQMQFDDVNGLTLTTPVFANGYKVGIVKEIQYDYENPQKAISVGVDIDKNMKIPEGTKAEIVGDLMGNIQVNLILGNGKKMIAQNGLIGGSINKGALGDVQKMIPSIEKMLPKLDSILANVNNILSDPGIKSSIHNVDKITADLTTSTKQLNALLFQMNGALPTMTVKANSLLANANGMMVNANRGITEARNAIKGANGMIANLNNKVNALDVATTMAKVHTVLDHVNTLTTTLNSNKGSLGLLINDPTLYHNLNSTLRDVDSLMVNLKAHPKRYVHFSIFGRKDK